MREYRLAVCEDDQNVRDAICQVCDKVLTEKKITHKITSFSSAWKLDEFLKAWGEIFHLLILDIEMEQKTGLELARELRERNDRVSIIFITGHEKYIRDGYDVQPVHFLLKPLDWEKLKKAVMTDWKLNYSQKAILLQKGARKLRLPLDSILYAEPDGNHGVQIFLQDGTIDFPIGLTELEKQLPASQFSRCHHSYLVNLGHVRELFRQTVCLDNGKYLPVSRKYYKNCQEAFVAYMNC